jgi:RNA polymerase sigma-70 factor (ECF subfamily)
VNAQLHAIAGREDPLRDLLGSVARGDEGALRRLHDMTCKRLLGLLRRLLSDEAAAEDVLSEVYVQAWRRADNFDPKRGSGWLWLVTIARRRAIDRVRSARVRPASALEESHGQALRDPEPGPSDHALGSEAAERVRVAVRALPSEQRQVLEASFLGGQSHTEVAEALALPLGTIKSRIRAGLATLRRSMPTEEEEGAA